MKDSRSATILLAGRAWPTRQPNSHERVRWVSLDLREGVHAVIGIGATEHVLQQQWPRPLDSALRSGAERVAKHCDADHACWTAAERVGENLQLGFAHTRARARMQLDTPGRESASLEFRLQFACCCERLQNGAGPRRAVTLPRTYRGMPGRVRSISPAARAPGPPAAPALPLRWRCRR